MDFQTQAVHSGYFHDENAGSVTAPIYLSTTFERNETGVIGPKGYIYTRLSNPNRTALEKMFATLEQGKEAFAFSSGMAATLAVFQCVLEPGAHVIISDDCYHGIVHLLKSMYPRWKVTYSEVDMTNVINVKNSIRLETKLILVETPSNPQLKIADISAIVAIAQNKNIVLACDNTWATPYITQPILLGVDLVIHSSTKYFGGHSDILGGCVISKDKNEVTRRIREFQTIGGSVPSPFDCWLLVRSIATMPLRIKQQASSAIQIAQILETHPKIEKVFYPGLSTHTNHQIAARQMKTSFGAMLSVLVKGGEKEAMAFAGKLKIIRHATSLGGVESLIEHRLTAEGENPKSPPNLLRISIGIEATEDLVNDILQALN